MTEEQRQYPIGKFIPKETYSREEIDNNILRIETLPQKVKSVYTQLLKANLDKPYRDGGWTARQVIHHLADSHMNAFIRFKWTLTENTPLIKAYDEKKWAVTFEVTADPILSIALLEALHAKWAILMKSLSPTELKKQYNHPESGRSIALQEAIASYAWHGDHHLGHLKIIAGEIQ